MPVHPTMQGALDLVRPLSHPRDYRAEATQIAKGGPIQPEREHLIFLLRELTDLHRALSNLGDREIDRRQVTALLVETHDLRDRLRAVLAARS